MGFLKSSARSQTRGSVFFTEIMRTRRKEIESRKKEFLTPEAAAAANKTDLREEVKFYPSGMVIGMCPREYLLTQQGYNGIEDLSAIYRVKRGSAIHYEFQTDFLLSNKIYPKPQIRLSTRMEGKLAANWPEVPFHLNYVSGSADAVMDWEGPVPVEIKSTSVAQDKWAEHVSKNLPSLQHETQVGLYRWSFNNGGYYPVKVKRCILAYQNLLFQPPDDKGRVEFIIEEDYKPRGFAETLDELVEELILKGVVPTVESYLQDGISGVVCEYPRCRKHGRTNPTDS